MQWLAIAVGGAAGAVLRYGVSVGVTGLTGRAFPFGTLVVNVAGSLAIGVLYVLLVERVMLGAEWRAALLIGLLGAFTTFSTFSVETMLLVEGGEVGKAVLNALSSVVLCLIATWFGMIVGREL